MTEKIEIKNTMYLCFIVNMGLWYSRYRGIKINILSFLAGVKISLFSPDIHI